MKKIYVTEEALYYRKGIEKTNEINVEKLEEHVENVNSGNIEINVEESVQLNECNKINIKINKDEFKSLFGPNAKPRKGDYLSITKAQKKFKVKKAKKFTAKKSGKGYKLSLKETK